MNFLRVDIKEKVLKIPNNNISWASSSYIVPYFSNGRRAALSIFPSRTDAAVVPRWLEAVAL